MDARVHDGPDAPIVRLRWVYTDAPFLPVGTGCVVNNRIWNADWYSDIPVGQLSLPESRFVQDARWALPPGFHSDHICHPEWLAVGEPWPNDLPPTEYSADQIPLCCLDEPEEAEGGVAIGGQSGDTYTIPDSTYGGVAIGGEAGDQFHGPDPAEGGVAIGGQSGDTYTNPDPAEGGVAIGGEAGDQFHGPDPTEGGVEIGGEAGDVYIEPPHGEIVYDVAIETTFTAVSSAPYVVECWGPGGNGTGQTLDGAPFCSGGGGGAYARKTVLLTNGATYAVVVQSSGSELPTTFAFGDVVRQVIAAPGENATEATPGAGGLDTNSEGDVAYSGGNGATFTGVPSGGGGGGGGAGSGGVGNPGTNGIDPTGGTGGAGTALSGGDGGAGGDVGLDGFNGLPAGGGGGGGGTGSTVGGSGARGRMRIVW